MKILASVAFVAAVAFPSPGLSQTAQALKAKTPPRAAQATPSPTPQADAAPTNTPAPPGWVARCSSANRDTPLECAVEQTAVLTKTGPLIVLFNVRVAGDTRQPLAVIQLPLGLNLPAGAKLQVDDGKVSDVQILTCEQRGCYANSPISPEMLAAMKSGKQLSFQHLGQETITIPMPLAVFAAAYDKIK